MSTYIIGQITLLEPITYRQHYETASWYTDYAIPAGTYDVLAYGRWMDNTLRVEYYNVWFEATGTVTGSLFVNRLFTASSVHKDGDVGQVRPTSVKVSLMDARLTLIDGIFLDKVESYVNPRLNREVAVERKRKVA